MIAKCKYKYEVDHTSNLFLIIQKSIHPFYKKYLCSKEVTARVKINKPYLGRFYNFFFLHIYCNIQITVN